MKIHEYIHFTDYIYTISAEDVNLKSNMEPKNSYVCTVYLISNYHLCKYILSTLQSSESEIRDLMKLSSEALQNLP